MNKKILILVIVALFIVTALFTIGKYTVNGKSALVNPGLQPGLQKSTNETTPQASNQPSTPSYNAPQEIKYGSATDLQKELETINPQVLDSDFNE